MKAHVSTTILLASTTMLSLVWLAACNSSAPQAGVQTNSTFITQYGNTQSTVNDASAEVTAGSYTCSADGSGVQNGDLPYSPAAGACYFPDLYTETTYNFDDISFDCLAYWSSYTDDSSYWEENANINTGQSGIVNLAPPNCVLPLPGLAPNLSTNFAISGNVPSTITAYASGFSSTYGMPKLQVYSTAGSLVGISTATSVAGNGSSATFSFPTAVSGGGPLPSGFYFVAPKDFTNSTGGFEILDGSYFSIGGNTTLSSAFGVDASDVTQSSESCVVTRFGSGCTTSGSTYAAPIITQYYSNQVAYYTPNTTEPGGLKPATFSVGTEPVAAKLYGSSTSEAEWPVGNNGGFTKVTTTFASNAIVVNYGSNTVSLVDFATMTGNTVTVGTQPMAVALNSAATFAYVPNYGSGTLSEVDLSTQAVSRTATVGAGVQSVAMDPSGNDVWVGGTNYLYEVSLSTFTVVASYSVSGSITSMAASDAQNELVYTLVQNCCSQSSTYVADEVSLSNMAGLGSHAQTSAAAYEPYTMNGTLPSAAAQPSATAVSAKFGNGLAASATSTGFVIYDVVSHKTIMTGSTPTPVRGIAADMDSLVAYFTLPDSNEYITVPLPQP